MSSNKNSLYAFYSTTQENSGKNIIHNDSYGKRTKNVRYNIYELLSGKQVMVTETARRLQRPVILMIWYIKEK